MERKEQEAIYWNRPYGWRAGGRYVEPGASAVDVIRFEQEELGNELDVPEFLLEELDKKGYRADDVVWVCRTRDHARRYAGRSSGQPYREDFEQHALVVATDHEEPEQGYLVLFDASRVAPAILERFSVYCQAQKDARQIRVSPRIV